MASRKASLRDVCNRASRKGGKSGKIVFVWRQNFARRGPASRKGTLCDLVTFPTSRKGTLRDAGPRRAKLRRAKSLCATLAVLGRANHVCATKFSPSRKIPSRKQVFLLVWFESKNIDLNNKTLLHDKKTQESHVI